MLEFGIDKDQMIKVTGYEFTLMINKTKEVYKLK